MRIAAKTIKPSSSYSIVVPEDSQEEFDGAIASFWRPGEQLLLQLSSYLRHEGEQLDAATRMRDRMSKLERTFDVWRSKIHSDASVDQSTAEFTDQNGVLWLYSYLVWPHLTIFATVSGPAPVMNDDNNWAIQSIKSIRLTIH